MGDLYLGNPNLKSVGVPVEWTDESVTEFVKCSKNLRHFINSYVQIVHVDKGLVPFEMKNIRPAWCPKALGFNFLETNIRTYVLHKNEPGVFFFSLDASSLIAVKIARWIWHLPYFHSGMTFSNEKSTLEYSLKRDNNIQSNIKIKVGQPIPPSQPDSLEYFLLERYLLFTQLRGRILRGQVHHVPYPARSASLIDFEDQLLEVNGFTGLNTSPDLIHFSTGVDVEIYSLKRTN